MTIDELLDRLPERHQALTGNMEVLTADLAQLTGAVSKMGSRTDDLMTGFSTLLELARSDEVRIGRLEGR
ncbi:MAG TPA: hypothetical protein VGR47_10910 [Terracidiphilus sp.]|nr:hypothetical protein [Terracidiphilus sp.]